MKAITIFSFCILFAGIAFGNVINVPGDQPTIQAGIDAAANGDTVLVAENTYFENINFKGKAITVASLFIMDQDTSHISKTIIDGSKAALDEYGSTVSFVSGEDTSSVLCGFTITGGTGTYYGAPYNIRAGGGIICGFSGATIRNNHIINNALDDETVVNCLGGGINSGPPGTKILLIIENNVIKYNTITSAGVHNLGAGIYIGSTCKIEGNIIQNNEILSTTHEAAGGGMLITQVDSSIITNNIVESNKSLTNSDSFIGAGGGAYFWNCSSSLLIQNNRFANNEVKSAHKANGGGVTFENCGSEVQFINNKVIDNYYSGPNTASGGGIYITQNSEVQIIKNIITGNTAYCGGGIACYHSSNPEIKNNLIAYNTAGSDAGGIDFGWNSNPNVINNTIVENKAKWGGALAFYSNCDPVFMNSIIYGNSADSSGSQAWFWDDNSDPTFTYCDIEGGSADFGFYNTGDTYSGTYKNNIDSDPLFVASDSLFHLSANSPCVDAGNPDLQFKDPEDLDNPGFALWPSLGTLLNDMGAYGGQYPLIVTAIKDQEDIVHSIPKEFILYQNYPNPFNPTTTISYKLEVPGFVELSIYNVLGQKVATLVSTKQLVGQYKVEWDARRHSSGIYFYRLSTV
jgi:hypothetical protein